MSKIFVIIIYLSLFLSISCNEKNCREPKNDSQENIGNVVPPFNSNRLFIKYGLQLGCWVGCEDLEAERVDASYYIIDSNDWIESGFTGPTFFTAPNPFNPNFVLNDFTNTQWSIAKAPYGKHLKRGPTDWEMGNGFLSKEQKKAVSRLTSICFGDEDKYSDQIVEWTKQWYSIARKYYPDVILHNNQSGYGGQWSKSQMQNYIQRAKPDLLTFDAYYFLPVGDKINYYRGAKAMAEDLMFYRTLALEGYDGSGNEPISFGQYTQGYKQDGNYEISESELRLYYSMTWAFGGKWLNWFRWLQGNNVDGKTIPNTWCMLLENGIPRKHTKYMQWVTKCNNESKAIGDILVRLQTKNVFFKQGDDGITNGKPSNVDNWNSNNEQMLSNLTSVCTEAPYAGKKGDLYIGSFSVIPALKNGDPDFFSTKDPNYFMIVNAFTTNTDEFAKALSQKVTFAIKRDIMINKCLYVVSKESGEEKRVVGKQNGDEIFYSDEIVGGGYSFYVIK